MAVMWAYLRFGITNLKGKQQTTVIQPPVGRGIEKMASRLL